MIEKAELVEQIEKADLEIIDSTKDTWEKKIYLDDEKVLIVGYEKEEKFEEEDPEEETVTTFYWYWELRNSQNWDILFEKRDKKFSFCESEHGSLSDDDQIEDVVGDIDEEDICTWSEQDFIDDISEEIAETTLKWLKSLK
ncbi:MAG TPA: hypothetical protein VLR54_04990 [Methanobacteriaceae archaeon]|nr:hypothetical protein [Methanobacteriaceae archaeon]